MAGLLDRLQPVAAVARLAWPNHHGVSTSLGTLNSTCTQPLAPTQSSMVDGWKYDFSAMMLRSEMQ